MIVEIVITTFLIILHIITTNFIEDNWLELKVNDDDYKIIAKYPFINIMFLVVKLVIVLVNDWCRLYKNVNN
jgi:hypothetical protein